MTVVRIPPVLRQSADGNKQVELEGATVGEVLQQLVQRFPELRDQLFTGDGMLNRFVNVYLNSEDVRYLSELATPAGARDTIVVLPAMAGGARDRLRVASVGRRHAPTEAARPGAPDTNHTSARRESPQSVGLHRRVQPVTERGWALRRGLLLRGSPVVVA